MAKGTDFLPFPDSGTARLERVAQAGVGLGPSEPESGLKGGGQPATGILTLYT